MRTLAIQATLWAVLLGSLSPGAASAHGLWGHIHVTGWAVENMPDDALRRFLLEPEVFNALLFGAVFTDTGYARDEPAARAYAEHTHWEPFIEDYVEWILENDPPPWDSLASRKRVAFLLGCASHGLQDSIFDSLFLYQAEAQDGTGQDKADPAIDGFLVLDEHIRFIPEQDMPMSTLLELYESLDEEVTQAVIEDAVRLVTAAYINDSVGLSVAATLGEQYADAMPWTRTHYLDPSVPGSLRAEIYPTMRYQQALWARLHGTLSPDDVTVFAFPESPRRLRSGEADSPDSWVTLIFGAGIRYDEDLVSLLDDSGAPVPFTQANTRWGAGHTRLIRVLPEADLAPGGWYTARMRSGARLINGTRTTVEVDLPFQVACLSDSDPACPDLGPIQAASIDGIPKEPAQPQPAVAVETGCGCATSSARPQAGVLTLLLSWMLARRRCV